MALIFHGAEAIPAQHRGAWTVVGLEDHRGMHVKLVPGRMHHDRKDALVEHRARIEGICQVVRPVFHGWVTPVPDPDPALSEARVKIGEILARGNEHRDRDELSEPFGEVNLAGVRRVEG